jgi:predicted nuclease of predicted toxin-antitoxin system
VKIKLDENLPARLVSALSALGHEADTVYQEGLSGCDDRTVWDAAQKEERFLITQDLDFSDIRRYAPGTHHGLLLIRLRDPGREALLRCIRGLFETEPVASWTGCVVIATDRKLRIRRPPDS